LPISLPAMMPPAAIASRACSKVRMPKPAPLRRQGRVILRFPNSGGAISTGHKATQ
jgi:hypothetical protein